MIQLLALVCGAIDLGGYFLSTKIKRERIFHWANVLTGPFIVLTEIATGAYGLILLTGGWWFVGLWGLWQTRLPQELRKWDWTET